MDLVCLRSMVLDHLAGFSEEETNFISKVFIQDQSENAELVPNLRKHFTVSDENDPIDDIMSSSVWEKLRASMKESFGQLWHEKCLYFQMPNQLLLALNSRFPLPPPVFDSPADASERRIELIRKGYDCSLIINNLFLKGAIYRSSKKLLRHDYDTILGEIISQDVGVSCTHTLFAAQQKHLRKFCGMNFSISHFRRELQKSKQLKFPIGSEDVGDFISAIIDKYVSRRLIGSNRDFNQMKRNLKRCIGITARRPMSLGMLMKGLPFRRYPQNVFMAKLVLFLAQLFANQLVKRLLYATESHKNRKLLFFLPEMWKKYENNAVATMIRRGTLREVSMSHRDGRITRMKISFNARRFRPLVLASYHHKMTRTRLSVCNALLKQLVHTINPSYGRTLNQIHSHWQKLNKLPKAKPVYFVRTDIADAFPSIDHAKLHEVLTRRLAEINPIQICRSMEYNSKGRRKSMLIFTTMKNRLSKQKVYCVSRKKVYTTAYLKAVILQYVKQTYITIDKQTVYLQAKGLPQGCHLSPILCELYLSDMDSRVFSTSGDTALIRAVDDYLFITTDASQTEQFLEIVKTGVSQYNMSFQRAKTVTNARAPIAKFDFFGYNFRPSCRKISPDFANFNDLSGRIFLSPKMTWSDLPRRMETVTSLKMHGLIVDAQYLHKYEILKNIFLCARTHARYYRLLHDFLSRNYPHPSETEVIAPISAATHALSKKVVQINKDNTIVTYEEAQFASYLAYLLILPDLRQHLLRKMSKIQLQTRSRKLMKSLKKFGLSNRIK
ncbi:Hypothetical protein NTJ_08910 [Nesidiocoris tenuis]|uniref:Telomerase reverse transcriptase n=1 Tax=Nesidiocoris tenuis TaxID=355587 RepID=A0ABN7AV90_9HEMI|nr:Hypothetical protein NTJ_08910 [Nesidiocoris tenuis]